MNNINIDNWERVRSVKDERNSERSVNNSGVDLYKTPNGEYRVVKWVGNPTSEQKMLELLNAEYRFRQNIVEFYGRTVGGSREGLVLEAMVKETGWQKFTQGTRYPTPQAFDVIQQLGAVLAGMHERGYAIGDFKQDDIFVKITNPGDDGLLKLIDFGLGRWPGDNDMGQSFDYIRKREIRLATQLVSGIIEYMKTTLTACMDYFAKSPGTEFRSDYGSRISPDMVNFNLLKVRIRLLRFAEEFRVFDGKIKLGSGYHRIPELDKSSEIFDRLTKEMRDVLRPVSEMVPWTYLIAPGVIHKPVQW